MVVVLEVVVGWVDGGAMRRDWMGEVVRSMLVTERWEREHSLPS